MTTQTHTDYDVVIIGAGFAGLRMLYEARTLGLTARVLEAGSDLGGTWFWNRYPGARTDSESWDYVLSFSEEVLQEWEWSQRYPTQDEVQRYLRFIADRFAMTDDISFDTRVTSARYDTTSGTWAVTTESGDTLRSTYLVSAVGLLSAPLKPAFPGLDSFRGDWYLSAQWPEQPVDLTGKRVGLIGTGATGIQIVPEVAGIAAELTVFQRTPNYVLPRRDRELSKAERDRIKAEYPQLIDAARNHFFGFSMGYAGRVSTDVTPDEQRAIFEKFWDDGGFAFIFKTFDDNFVSEDAANAASEFIREKIRETVDDPATAELLCPRNYPLAAKRPPLGSGYYEAFNRDNVHLVDVSTNAITEITPTGIKTLEDEHEFDVIIFATGFDAATGALTAIDIRGTDGVPLTERWADGPRTAFGITVENLPNFFMISGPQSPFANIPVVIDNTVDWIGKAIEHTRTAGYRTIEPKKDAVDQWKGHLDELLAATILGKGAAVHSWFLGANVPGKAHEVLFYFGGVNNYFAECAAALDNFDQFEFTR